MNRQGISKVSFINEPYPPEFSAQIQQTLTPRVLMIGPSLKEEGGMGAVSRLILNYVQDPEIGHLASWNNIPGSRKLPSKLAVIRAFVVAWFVLVAKLLSNQFDLLHCHMAERGSTWRTVVFALTAYLFRKPVIIHTHGAEFHLFYESLPSWSQNLIKWVLKKAQYAIVLSQGWQEYYSSQCGLSTERVVVLYNPVEYPEVICQKEARDGLKLLFLGKINQRKGIYDLLKSLAVLKQDFNLEIKLLLAGSGEIASAIKQAEKLGIAESIDVLGWVDKEQKNRLLAEADGFILPSYNEGLPMAMLEAMSYGLPIITTPVGGIGEVITDGKTGLLLEAGNIEQLTAAIRSWATDTSLRRSLGENARVKAKEFSIDRYTHSLCSLYSQALNRSFS